LPEACFAISQIARMSGDRTRDIDDDLRETAIARLRNAGANPHWIRAVAEFTELERSEEGKLLGDAAPPGLRLASG
jgi:hypothetical protein